MQASQGRTYFEFMQADVTIHPYMYTCVHAPAGRAHPAALDTGRAHPSMQSMQACMLQLFMAIVLDAFLKIMLVQMASAVQLPAAACSR